MRDCNFLAEENESEIYLAKCRKSPDGVIYVKTKFSPQLF